MESKEKSFLDDNGNFIHPWGAQAASRFHASLTGFLSLVGAPFRWALDKALGMDKLEQQFQSIIVSK